MGHSTTPPDYGMGKKKFSVYLYGTIACLLLTIAPFYIVMHRVLEGSIAVLTLFAFAAAQFFVQVLCFLRLNTKTPQGMTNTMSFIFTILILLVLIGGSLWIMWTLDYRMMH